MAKEFDNPLDRMASLPDPEVKHSDLSRGRTRKQFKNPLDQVSATETGRAVGSSLVAGQYIRRTFTFTPGQLRRVKEIALELHISETAIARWLIDEGLLQWERGVRPEVEQRTIKLEPKLRDW